MSENRLAALKDKFGGVSNHAIIHNDASCPHIPMLEAHVAALSEL